MNGNLLKSVSPDSAILGKRPKVMVLTTRLPFPPIGGDRLRIFHICRMLAEHADVTLLSLCENKEQLRQDVPKGMFARCERVLLPSWKSRWQVLKALVGRKPLQVAYYETREFGERLSALIPTQDVVLAHLIRTVPYVEDVQVPLVVEMTDAPSMTYDRAAKQPLALSVKSLAYRLEANRIGHYERAVSRIADVISLISPIDARWMIQRGAPVERVLVSRNGVDLDRRRIERAQTPNEVVFVGHMATLQNQDSVRYYIHEVMPLVRQKRRLKLRVIGPCPDKFASELSANPDVIVHGIADDLSEAMGHAACGICFMRVAGGMQNKILDYMSVGVPAVVNGMAWEGLMAQPGRDLERLEAPAEQAHAILRFAEDETQWKRFSDHGLSYVMAHHGWGKSLAPLIETVLDLAGARDRSEKSSP